MKTTIPLFFFFFFNCIVSAQNPKIVGGQDAEEGQFPWMACMYVFDGPGCGGVLVAPDWVLTAAHCVFDEDLSIFSIRLNSINAYGELNPDGGVQRDIIEAHIHPEYNYEDEIGQHVDLALFRLSEPVNSITPITLPEPDDADALYDSWSSLFTAGWGMMAENGNTSFPEILQWVESTIYDFGMCEEVVGYSITDDFFCVGYTEGQTPSGAGTGDSGGPAWIEGKDGTPVLTGIVHGATWDYTDADLPGVYVAVARQLDWINSVIGAPTHTTDETSLGQFIALDAQRNKVKIRTNNFQGSLKVQILNIQGATLVSEDFMVVSDGHHELDGGSLSTGIYIVHVNDQSGRMLSEKLFIWH